MKKAHFTVRVNYQSSTFQITADEREYSTYGTICNTLSLCMTKMFQITDRLSKQGVKAEFTFVNKKEDK